MQKGDIVLDSQNFAIFDIVFHTEVQLLVAGQVWWECDMSLVANLLMSPIVKKSLKIGQHLSKL